MIKITKFKGLEGNISMPIQLQESLDESLDLMYVELKNTNDSVPYEILKPVEIEITDGKSTKVLNMVIESDNVIEVVKNKKYNHNLMLIEETKLAERYLVDKSVNQKLIVQLIQEGNIVDDKDAGINVYKKTWTQVEDPIFGPGAITDESNTQYVDSNIKLNYENEDISLPKFDYFINASGGTKKIEIKDWHENLVDYTGGFDENVLIKTNKDLIGTLSVKYSYISDIKGTGIGTIVYKRDYITVEFLINFFIREQQHESLVETVKEVIDTLCITAETIRESQTAKYSLANINDYDRDNGYKSKVEEIYNSICPEFSFGKMSLFEALMQIGGRFNFQPRIRNNKIFLDLLGDEEIVQDIGQYYSNTKSQNSNNFCSKLDSFASNITGVENYDDGTDITPMFGQYKTVRAEYGQTQVKDDNIIFATEYPIEKPVKLEIGYVGNTIVGDITAYLYEDSEYNLLSSYEDKYGAKNHAIKYTRGQKNITGLNYKRDVIDINEITNFIAIKNIICSKLGVKDISINFQELQFRLIYVPIIDARITQLNSYKSLGSQEIALAYNQSSSKISSSAYGNNLKTNVSMMGNVDSTKMFKLPTLDMIPEIGKRYDDYVITTVKSEYYPTFIKCELGLTENYTRKNEYIGLDSNLDIYELNRQNAIDRHVIYEDVCEISNTYNNETINSSLIRHVGVEEFKNTFLNKSMFQQPKISYVVATGYDIDGNSLGSFDIPLVSLGFGNSMALIYSYPDAVFTEPSVAYREQGFIESMKGAFREQYYSRYTDKYGKIDTLKLEYSTTQQSPQNYSDAVNIGNNLPKHQESLNPIKYFSTYDDKLQIKKDVGEKLNITYQMHFVKDSLTNNDYIIGSAMACKNNLISGINSYEYKIFLFKDKINKNQDRVNLKNAVEITFDEFPPVSEYENSFKLGDIIIPNGEYNSWAIVNVKNGENDLILAENRNMKGGEKIKMPYFNFKHKRR